MSRTYRPVAMAISVFLIWAPGARSQPEGGRAPADLSSMFTPGMGNQLFRADFRTTWYPDERVEGQPTKLGFSREDFSVSFPVWQCSTDEWTGSAHVRSELFNTSAVLPDTGQRFPQELWNIRLGTSYRHLFDNGWIGGGSVNFGTATDKPFHSINEMTLGASAYVRIPQGEHNAWLFSLNYSSNSEFLSGVPIPGVAYFWAPTEWFQATIGVPFASIRLQPIEDLTLQLSYAPITNIHAKAIYRVCRPLRIYGGFDWGPESYLLADRQDDRDRLFYYEKKVTAGIVLSPNKHVSFDLSGGYAFDRFYYEGHDFQHQNFNRVSVDDGPFASFQVQVRF